MRAFVVPVAGVAATLACAPVAALDRPWIADVYFYWYTWDYEKEMGNWIGGVYNTPLVGYYDSRRYEDNLRELHMASEWGITHHFMDFWGYGWKDTEGDPREAALIRATEALQDRGYDIHMGFYQDGTDFDMKDFAANIAPGRHVYWLFNNFGKSRAMPLVNGKPLWLVYGRNGRPQPTDDEDGFRKWLQTKYRNVAELNEAWGTQFAGFDEATMDFGSGVRRADSIKYQYAHWEREMSLLDGKAMRMLGLRGLAPSFDVAWQPFMGFGYSDFARVLNGPHSYGGIFGQPQEQDVERFIQTAVAKRYGTVCFDTFKNFYHDWEIRTPGTCYPPEPCHFDRFWVGNLMRYAEAMLHLSWNEWWEGSNLEPCLEHGKAYCEKNLLYSTIMRLAFDSIHGWNRGAEVAVLLNDWHWLVGGKHPEDIYNCIQALRRENVTFDLLPDDFVTDEQLSRVKVLIVPAAYAYRQARGVELGRNRRGEQVTEVIKRWIRTGKGRRLLVSDMPSYRRWLDIKEAEAQPGAVEEGPDMTLYVDVGEQGDERFLLSGATQREDWGNLPPGAYGATDEHLTVRWTPGSGSTSEWLVPLSPNREHLLRIAGSSIWGNTVHVLLDGVEAASFDLQEGLHSYEVTVPADVVGAKKAGVVALKYERANVPRILNPQRFPNEGRVC
ncbi:MAG: beta-galactosidase, partial [Armatimonadota bacterium]